MICLFIVRLKRIIKYITRIGQNTGILKIGNRVSTKATKRALVPEYLQISSSSSPITCYVNTDQNLNSGSLLTNGLNSWLALVGSAGPSSVIERVTIARKQSKPTVHLPISSSSRWAGSNFGVRKEMKRFSKYIASP